MSDGYLTPQQLRDGLGQLPGGAYHREPEDEDVPLNRDPDAYCPRCHEPADKDCRCTGADYPERKDLPSRGMRHFFTNDDPPGVAYTVRDEQGRVVEIVSEDGQRTYVTHDDPPTGN
jgi:YD repeat-containing protein